MGISLQPPICVDLFCGAGGLSHGLTQAGYNPVLGLDFDEEALASYAANHRETPVIGRDISRVSGAEIKKIIGKRQVDLLAGGPSCQGFSTHGKREADDPRNFLFKHFMRVTEEIKPRWVLIENVKGLLTYRDGYFRNVICESLQRLGYEVACKVLCAADYGVPQFRHRIFFIANRIGVPLSFPNSTHGDMEATTLFGRSVRPYVTVGDALEDLPLLMNSEVDPTKYSTSPQCSYQRAMRAGSRVLTHHYGRPLSAQADQLARFIGEGQGLRSAPSHALPERFKKMRRISTGELRRDCTTLYYRLDRKRPSYTITCNFRNVASGPFMHPIENRSISPREAARLMSFNDNYIFTGSGVPRQIGNAVPPLFAKAVASHIRLVDSGVRIVNRESATLCSA